MARLASQEAKLMSRCPICGGMLEAKRVAFPQEYNDAIVIVENVPAEVCRQCGEVMLRPEVLEGLQELVWSGSKPSRTVSVAVYEMAGD